MNILLLMMGGNGTRFGADIPKQYILIDGIPVFTYILNKFNEIKDLDNIIIVSNKDWIDYVQSWVDKFGLEKVIDIVPGGESRSESVLNGLMAVSKWALRDDIVLIHDATHPYVDSQGIVEIIQHVKQYGAATLGEKQYDTIYMINEDNIVSDVIPRERIISAGSPEAFKFGLIYNIYKNTPMDTLQKMSSAGALALANGISMKVIPARQLNLKITYAEDMMLFEKLIHTYFFPPKQ